MQNAADNGPDSLREAYGNRAVLRIAIPMIVSWVSVPLLGIVDTAVMGRLDEPQYLAAVAAGATVFSVLFMGLNFLRMGTTGIAAQAFGAGDDARIGEALLRPLVIAMLLALVLLVLQQPILAAALTLLGTSDAVSPQLATYFSVRIWSAPAMLVNLALFGWLLGMQNARAALIAVLVVNASNIVLDIVFVLGLGMRADGVAAATVIAEYLGTAVIVVLVRQTLGGRTLNWHLPDYLRPAGYARLFRINSSLFLRSVALMFTFAFITARGARLGDEFLAANAVLLNFLYLYSYAQDGVANAAEALTGKAVGARNRPGLDMAVSLALRWAGAFALLYTGVYVLAGGVIVDGLTTIPGIRALAREFLPWLWILPLASAACFFYDGVYIGATRTREMMLVMAGCTLGVFLPVWFVLQEDWGNHALWAALIAFMSVRSLGMHLWYRRLARSGAIMQAD